MYNQLNAYQATQKVTIDPRTHQAQIFHRASYKLQEAKNNWGDARLLHDALQYNLRFWTIIQSDTLEENCPFEKTIRLNILRLSSWVDKRTFEIYDDPKPELLNSLINVNNQMADGLLGKA
jgi:flagellar protein FlaF